MESLVRIIVRFEDQRSEDKVSEMSDTDTGIVVTPLIEFHHVGDYHVREYPVYRGSFLMKKVRLAAFRKTRMGNTMIEQRVVNLTANNY